MESPYHPIDCGYHDRLLELATLRRSCEIVHLDAAGRPRIVQGRIEDVYSRSGAEFMRVSDGSVVRLDRLLRVDGIAAPQRG